MALWFCERNGDAKRPGTPFSTTGGKGFAVRQIGPQVVWIATLLEKIKQKLDSSLPLVAHIWVTLSNFYTVYMKKTQRMVFKKIVWSQNKTRLTAEGISFFKLSLLNYFLEI